MFHQKIDLRENVFNKFYVIWAIKSNIKLLIIDFKKFGTNIKNKITDNVIVLI